LNLLTNLAAASRFIKILRSVELSQTHRRTYRQSKEETRRLATARVGIGATKTWSREGAYSFDHLF